jgi:biopolymer transport protein ExbD
MARTVTRFDEINITPLTDIFLVLLIIMMVVAPMLEQQGLSLNLPTVSTAPATPSPEQPILRVVVQADNTLTVNARVFNGSKAELVQLLQGLKKDFTGGAELNLHPKAQYKAGMMAMDAIQGAGIKALSIVETQD